MAGTGILLAWYPPPFFFVRRLALILRASVSHEGATFWPLKSGLRLLKNVGERNVASKALLACRSC